MATHHSTSPAPIAVSVVACAECGLEFRVKPRCVDCGEERLVHPYPKGRVPRRCQRCCRAGRGGAANPHWKGGITPKNKKIRSSDRYKAWRKAVFERDDYTCVWCGQRGGQLNADHIKPFSTHPRLRFKLSNGRTLCVACHKKTDTYLARALTKARKVYRQSAFVFMD